MLLVGNEFIYRPDMFMVVKCLQIQVRSSINEPCLGDEISMKDSLCDRIMCCLPAAEISSAISRHPLATWLTS